MKSTLLFAALLLWSGTAFAQNDPTIMTINGKPVSRSEFEYSYNKNNTESVIDKKSVEEYVDLFVNYKLKVEAALDAKLDTMRSFQQEFATYRDQQVRPSVITNADVEGMARNIYNETRQRVDKGGGLVKPAHILVLMKQKASQAEIAMAKQRIDSVYNALLKGADFAELARKVSDDKGSAANGGELPWLERGQALKEFEDQAYALKKGEMSKPFESPAGWHILLLKDKRNFFPYDSVRADIVKFIDQRGLREAIIDKRLDSLAKAAKPATTPAAVLAQRQAELEASDPAVKYLIQEYHDGLLLYEISNRTVWDKASKDEAGLKAYFARNKKRYKWAEPRFKGIAYHVKDKRDVKNVRNAVKRLPFVQWAERLRKTFNNDSILRIRVEKGIFKKGDNSLVDNKVFKTGATARPVKDFPIDAVYGKKLKTPQEVDDVRSQVLVDYQESLEKKWVEELRRKYPVEIDQNVLKTVNKH
ncbi:peptidylprolyl isomerase [Prevotella sp. KH2C16]|uniref:peptidylprolyl isomerase n=1 Tax=Prevotella sp. KH2C16 TaxID=1855325 RepID=UPI0008E48F9D|nr:peptidylprolyl isomerase [Prevotella sp. KH2C16]SFG66881.1 peptidyl-prolyl cis-trans isomerase SurA [Prevotella sp. KH2C16]